MAAKSDSELVSNRAAYHHYEILDKFEAGIVLVGTEVKSLKENGGSLQESYVKVEDHELWLVNAHIAPYKQGGIALNHQEKRQRKLLMHKREILRLKALIAEKGFTLVALSIYLTKGKIKVLIAQAKGKRDYDKRQKIKSQEANRAIQKALKEI